MSIRSGSTSVSSILKPYSPIARNNTLKNKVTFEQPNMKTVEEILKETLETKDLKEYQKLLSMVKEQQDLCDTEFIRILREAKRSVHLIDPIFSLLVESIFSLDWSNRSAEAIEAYKDFFIELVLAKNSYTKMAVIKLLTNFIPSERDEGEWKDGNPSEMIHQRLEHIHQVLNRLISLVPMLYTVLVDLLKDMFPYFKRPNFMVSGYIHNMLWITEYAGHFREDILEIIFNRLLVIDVSAPRNEIEELECNEDEEDDEAIFHMDDELKNDPDDNENMKHPIAETLDICMEKMLTYLQKCLSDNSVEHAKIFKILLNLFDNHILPTHNTHHVQFLLFYFCSFKLIFAEDFINSLWRKVCNPNMSMNIRQASVGYLASILARATYIPLSTLKCMLLEFSTWAHQYIQRSDSMQFSQSIKAHVVFYSVCQAIFYIVAFRSKHLTSRNKDLAFLMSLQLSSLVTCHLNPLRVCLPAVATAFAGVTRAHQLAYCHTILERNARRKLATIYTHDAATPDECLETFYPFDPYILKKSGKKIKPIYLEYQPSEEEEGSHHDFSHGAEESFEKRGRKRMESVSEDVDDFIQEKKLKLHDFTYSYGISPGFHN